MFSKIFCIAESPGSLPPPVILSTKPFITDIKLKGEDVIALNMLASNFSTMNLQPADISENNIKLTLSLVKQFLSLGILNEWLGVKTLSAAACNSP